MANSGPASSSSESCLYIKVQQEGYPGGRNVDLYRFSDYQSLEAALSNIFDVTIGFGEYTLMYLDEDGDWMMAGDDSWDHFLSTVKKLKITDSKTPYT